MSIRASGKSHKVFNVEIRPPRWKEKIWIGKFETLERAQLVTDAVRHYIGRPPVHFEKGVMMLPTIKCIGTVKGPPVELSSREECANYVRVIAKGDAFKPQRADFKQKVKDVVNDVGFPFLAPSRTDMVVLDSDDRDREDEFVFDEDVAKALEMFSHSGSRGVPEAVVQTHVAGPDSRQFHDSEPLAPMSKPEFSIDSGGISGSSSGTTSWRYKGVSHWMNEWVAEIQVPDGNKGNMGMRIRLDEYPTPIEAAFAYDVAVMCLGGCESMRNFHHPIYEQIPRILPDLSPWFFELECRKVVWEFWKLAKEFGNSVPMTLVGKRKDNTNSGGNPRGLQGTSQECPDLCPECSKTFLASQSMLHHLMDHWRNQKLSPPPQFSHDFGGDSWSPGMGSRWWSIYKNVRYWKLHDWEVDATRAVGTHNNEVCALDLNFSTSLEGNLFFITYFRL